MLEENNDPGGLGRVGYLVPLSAGHVCRGTLEPRSQSRVLRVSGVAKIVMKTSTTSPPL